jgi:hypothetical protein
MSRKIVGIFVMMLFITSAVLPVSGIIYNEVKHFNINNNLVFQLSNKYAWSGEGYGLDNEGIISVVVPSVSPVYLSFSTRYEIFSPDIGMVELSSDGGYNWYPMDSITGVQTDWVIRSVDISSFTGLPVLIRFKYTTGSFSTSNGWYVDTISVKSDIVEDFEDYNDGDYWGEWVIIGETGDLPPTVGITFPSSGNTVTGTIIITGEAHDPDGDETLDWVMVNIDSGDWEYADGTTSWSYVWDTTTVNDGLHIISAIAYDGIYQSTVATVSIIVDNGVGPGDQSDLVITDVWGENDLIYYQIRNIGDENASGEHLTALYVDNEYKAGDLIDIVLAPGERFTSYFDYDWDCTELEVCIWVIADDEDVINESNEANNKIEEFWKCDAKAPEIIYGPVVQNVAQYSATIYWTTDEDCDSTVRFDSYAGEYHNVVEDSELVKMHYVELTGLEPSTIYHYMVESIDATGNQVKSNDYYFISSPISDNLNPLISPFIPDVLSGIVNISVDVSDNVGVDRVYFSCDNKPIFVDYSSPFEWRYYSGNLDDGGHDFGFDAFDEAGNAASEALRGEVVNRFPPEGSPISVEIISPEIDEDFILGDVIHIYAKIETKIDIPLTQYSIVLDDDEWHPMYIGDIVLFPLMDDIIIPGIDPQIGAKVYWVNYWWDTRDYIPDGPTLIDVFAYDYDANYGVDRVQFNISVPPPDVQVFRDVERIGNYYQVELKIRNNGVVPVKEIQLYDTSVGFQCDDSVELDPPRVIPPFLITVTGGTESFSEDRNSFGIGDYSQIQIDIQGIIEIDPDEELYIWYYVVPVLFDPSNSVHIEELEWGNGTLAVPHVIGHKLLIEYSYVEEQYLLQKDDLRWDLSHNRDYRCAGDVSCAFRDADYLLVTSPTKLDRENPGSPDDVNDLLVNIAKLARLKNGVIGYTWTNSGRTLQSYISEDGDWWEKLCPRVDAHGRALFNYLLLVGETEIIPSRTKGGFDIEWSTGGRTTTVHLTDKPYSNIIGDGRPDLAVGRIIGNNASDLINPIKTSINVYNNVGGYEFDRSNVLLVSGIGANNQSFRWTVNETYDLLTSDETMYENVDKLHWNDYPESETNEFIANISNRDIVLYTGHGNPNWWVPGVHTDDADSLGFGSAKPFIYAVACLTGDYEDDDDYNIAEAFFGSLTSVYIGATEKSTLSYSDLLLLYFLENWDSSESIGKTFKDLKRHYYNDDDVWKYLCYINNLYGDPKYGIIPLGVLEEGNVYDLTTSAMNYDEPQSTLEIIIPDYEITSYKELDYIEIPGGEILLAEEGRPRVPYYTAYLKYPKSYRVQNVILNERTGLVTNIGLELPAVVYDYDTTSVDIKGDWYPQDDYTWRVEENDDGSTTLIIAMYPFYYNPNTTMVKFYKNYVFDIEYISSNMIITELYTDKDIYNPGDKINIDLWFENSGESQDFIVNLVVKQEISETVLDGLLLRSLRDFKGIGSYSITWDSTDIIADSYFIEAAIADMSGNKLDIETDMILLETTSAEIESISGGLGASAVIENNGAENLTDLSWSLSIEGNMIFLDGYKEGNIQLLKSGDSITIKSGFLLGFGPSEIIVNVAGVSKKANCFVIGPFVLDIQETVEDSL